MEERRIRVLISMPSLTDPGGVANYYRTILPFLAGDPSIDASCIEIGSTQAAAMHYINDPFRMLRRLSTGHFNLLHLNPSLKWKSFLRDGLFIRLARKTNIPVIVFFRGWDSHFEIKLDKWLSSLFRMTYLYADAFIVLADDFRNKLRSWKVAAPVYVESTTVDDDLMKGFDLEKKHAVMGPQQPVKILYLARLEKEKGIYEAVDVCTILSSKGYRLHLTVAGDGSEIKAATEYAAKRLGTQATFAGYVKGEAKRKIFETSDLYLFPSSYGEGMPNSVVEAMSFGLPIVTRPVGGIKDFFENGRMGYATESRNPEDLAVLVERLLLDRELRMAISAYNHAYAGEHFRASRVAARLKEIYRLTLSARPPRPSTGQPARFPVGAITSEERTNSGRHSRRPLRG